MSAANPYLGRWLLVYAAPGETNPERVFSWPSRNGGSDQAYVFHVYQQQPGEADSGPTYWVLQDFQDPAGWMTEPPRVMADFGESPAFGNVLRFGNFDAADTAPTRYLVAQFQNPPLVPASANPSPLPAASMPLGVYESGLGGEFLFGWGMPAPPSGPVPLRLNIMYATDAPVAPGLYYLKHYYGNTAPAGADYAFADLSGEDYGGLKLSGASFVNCDCTGTDFSDSLLDGAAFGAYGAVSGAKFCRAHMAGATFKGLDFTGVDFTGCVLTGSRFTSCKLSGLFFDQSLTGVVFTDCDLSWSSLPSGLNGPGGPTFAGCTLDNADFSWGGGPGDLSGCSFAGVKSMKGCRFAEITLLGTSFDRVPLDGVNFQGAYLRGALLTNTDLHGAVFNEPAHFGGDQDRLTSLSGSVVPLSVLGSDWSWLDLTGTRIDEASRTVPNLVARGTVMRDMQLTGWDLHGADFSGADLRGCDLANSNLNGAKFVGAQLQGDETIRAAVLSGAQMMNADLSGANLTGAQFSGALLWGQQVTLAGAIMERTNFTGAYLAGVHFVDVDQKSCRGAQFGRACLVNAVFGGTDCTPYQGEPASFASACLQGADFRDASLAGADLDGAAVSTAQVTVPATIQSGWPFPQPMTMPLRAEATLGIQAATGADSVCPNGERGPCSPDQQQAPQPPTSWPVTTAEHGSVFPGGTA